MPEFEDKIAALLSKLISGREILIFSCAEKWDSGPMWAHYAANHSGFALGFDPLNTFEVVDGRGRHIALRPFPIIYTDMALRRIQFGRRFRAPYQLKMTPWAYEKEWRFNLIEEQAMRPAQLDDRGFEILSHPLLATGVREIVFGLECSPETRTRVAQLVADRSIHVQYFELRQGPDLYAFSRVQIPDPLDPTSGRPHASAA